MERYKWLKVSMSLTLSELYKKLSELNYTEERKSGFEVVDFNRESLQFIFIREISNTQVIVDPFGDEVETHSVRYERIKTRAISTNKNNSIVFCLENPPISIKSMMQELSKISPVDFFVKDFFIDLSKFFDSFNILLSEQHPRLEKITVNNLKISKKSTARIELTSSNNALMELKGFFHKEDFSIDKLLIAFLSGKSKVEIRKNSIVKAKHELLEKIEKCILVQLDHY